MKEYILYQRINGTTASRKNNGKWGIGAGPYGTEGFATKLYTLRGARIAMTMLMLKSHTGELGFIHKDELNKPFNSLSPSAKQVKFG